MNTYPVTVMLKRVEKRISIVYPQSLASLPGSRYSAIAAVLKIP